MTKIKNIRNPDKRYYLTKIRFFCGITRIVGLVIMAEHAILFVLVGSYNRVRKKYGATYLINNKRVLRMVKRRTIIEDLHEEEQKLLVNVVEYKNKKKKKRKKKKRKRQLKSLNSKETYKSVLEQMGDKPVFSLHIEGIRGTGTLSLLHQGQSACPFVPLIKVFKLKMIF